MTLNAGSGGATIRTVDRTGTETQIVGLDLTPGGVSETLMAGSMPIDDNGGSLTVDNAGTFAVQATQAGTWDVGTVSTLTSITNVVHVDDNAGSLTVDGTVTANAGTGTFAVSAASLPLPSGAATAAKQPALGTAGTASADVITVQGIASMTALLVDGSATTQPVSGTVTANAGSGTFAVSGTVTANAGTNLNTSALAIESGGNLAILAGAVTTEDAASANADPGVRVFAVRKATPANTSGTDGDYECLQVSAGRLWVDASGKTLTVDASGAAVPITDNSGSITVDNAGTFATQAAQVGTWTVATNAVGTTGSAVPSKGLLVQGSDGTNARNLSTTSGGVLKVDLSGTAANATAVKVDGSAVTQPTSLASLPALAAGTALIGQVSASAETGTVYNGTTALTPKFKVITASASGATTIVSAVASKKIRVLRWRVSANGTVNLKWQSHVTPTDISGLSYGTQFKDCGGGYCPCGHFETVAGEALDIKLNITRNRRGRQQGHTN